LIDRVKSDKENREKQVQEMRETAQKQSKEAKKLLKQVVEKGRSRPLLVELSKPLSSN